MADEIQDIVDENDNVVGKDTRDNIWKKGLQHNVRTVNIFIFNDTGEILVPQRSLTKKMWPGCYDFSCGENVQSKETYEEAVVRGLKEELNIENVRLTALGKLTPKDGIACFSMNFKCVYSGEIKNFSADEIESINWFTVSEIKKMLKENPQSFKRDFKEIFEAYF